jgi:hypothetical protein
MSKRKVLVRYLEEHVPVAVERIHLWDLEAMGISFAPCDIDALTELAWSNTCMPQTHLQTLKRFLDPQTGSLIPIIFKDRFTLWCTQP